MSVVTATYHRPSALEQAIRSVRWQTLTDWEHWVVGDACTDRTAAVVAAFNDPRVRFHNREVNAGEQSGPNNTGCSLARGQYLAFLNHDDLWLPDHLETLVEVLETSGADLAWSLTEEVRADGQVVLCNLPADLRYSPRITVPASSWVFRRSLWERIGPWRSYREIFLIPSQDWIFRAHRAGARMVCVPQLGVIALPSGYRKGSYVGDPAHEQRAWADRIEREPDFRRRELVRLATRSRAPGAPAPEPAPAPGSRFRRRSPAELRATLRHLWHHYPVRAVLGAGRAVAPLFGLHPMAVEHGLTFRRRGGFVERLRALRGLPARPDDTPSP